MVGSRASDRADASRMGVPHVMAETSYFQEAPRPRSYGRARSGCGNGLIPGIEAIRDAERIVMAFEDTRTDENGRGRACMVAAVSPPIFRASQLRVVTRGS